MPGFGRQNQPLQVIAMRADERGAVGKLAAARIYDDADPPLRPGSSRADATRSGRADAT